MSLDNLKNQAQQQGESSSAEFQTKSYQTKEEFFVKITQEVKKLHETVEGEKLTRLLCMTPKYVLTTFIPDQLRSLDAVRANQEQQIEEIRSLNQELQRMLDVLNLAIYELGFKNEYVYKLRSALSSQIANRKNPINCWISWLIARLVVRWKMSDLMQ